MTQAQYAVAAPQPQLRALARWLATRALDWEDWLTVALAFIALAGVTIALEDAGWTHDMPPLTLIGFMSLLTGMLLARLPGRGLLPHFIGWSLASLLGAAVTFWQTLLLTGYGDLGQRIDAIYFRFYTWFDIAFSGGISNDPLPFVVMVVGLTWGGVFFFAWSVFRWHNAWLGLIPGGVALFMNLLFVDPGLPLVVALYVIGGLLLLMRTNLMTQMRHWREAGVSYPPLLSLSYLHLTGWAVLFLLVAAWIAPVTGGAAAAGWLERLAQPFEGVTVHFVRLAGPLRVQKIVPLHDYTSVLPFQGSIKLRERELLSVKLDDPGISGTFLLRGAVYDEYASGGWKAGDRQEVPLAAPARGETEAAVSNNGSERLLPMTITVEAKSVVGTVLFTPGQPVSASLPARAKLPSGLLTRLSLRSLDLPSDGGASLTDEEVLSRLPKAWVGVDLERDPTGSVRRVYAVPRSQLPEALVLLPTEKLAEGKSYSVVGLIRDVPAEELRSAGRTYPSWVRDTYLQLPDSFPQRVYELAGDVAGSVRTPYDRAKAIESYLRELPVDYGIADTPPGQDTVDYFLFDARRGYFDYHASAMVVMLRALGIPARLAVGFVVDESDRDRDSGAYIVRDKDAYGWVEVYFPGHGWLEFNPTPDRPAALRPSQGSEIEVPPVDPSQITDLPVASDIIFPQPDFGGGGPVATSSGSGVPITLWVLLAVAAVLVASWGSAALGWRRSVAGLPYAQQVWEKTVRLASWGDLGPQPGQTPSDFARALAHRFRGIPDLDFLANAYNRSRFGRKDILPDEHWRLDRAWAHLRGPLAWEVIRKLWRRN